MTIVIKMGGHALDNLDPTAPVLVALARDVAELSARGESVVLVHGGGPQINELLETAGVVSTFVDGLRVTDATAMRYVDMALASVNRAIVAALNWQGVRAVGVSGVDGTLLSASPLGATWGHVAGDPRVNASVLRALAEKNFIPVVSPVASSPTGALLNCNADTAAGAIAGALDADSLVLLSDISQVRTNPDDASTGVDRVSLTEVAEMIASGAAREGMRPKLSAAAVALQAGARRVWLANGLQPHAVRDVLNGTTTTTEVVA